MEDLKKTTFPQVDQILPPVSGDGSRSRKKIKSQKKNKRKRRDEEEEEEPSAAEDTRAGRHKQLRTEQAGLKALVFIIVIYLTDGSFHMLTLVFMCTSWRSVKPSLFESQLKRVPALQSASLWRI